VSGLSVHVSPVFTIKDLELPAPEDIDLAPGTSFSSVGLSPGVLLTLPVVDDAGREARALTGTTDSTGVLILNRPREWDGALGMRVTASHPSLHVFRSKRRLPVDHEDVAFRCTTGVPSATVHVTTDGVPTVAARLWGLTIIDGSKMLAANVTSRSLGQTDAGGNVHVTRERANQLDAMVIEADGLLPQQIDMTSLWSRGAITIAMARGITWSIRVVDERNQPVVGCTCIAMSQSTLAPDWFPGMLSRQMAARCGMAGQTSQTDAKGVAVFSRWPTDAPTRVQVGDSRVALHVLTCERGEFVDLFKERDGTMARGIRVRPAAGESTDVTVSAEHRPAVILEGGFAGSSKQAVFQFVWTERYMPLEVAKDDAPDRSFRIVHIAPKDHRTFELRRKVGKAWRSMGRFEFSPGMSLSGLVIDD